MFVDRDDTGNVTGVYASSQYEGQEELSNDHADILAYLAPKPATAITNAQLKRQLDADDKLSAARAVVAQVDGLAEELWYGAAIFERDDPLFLQIAAVVGYDTDEKLDQFFAAASER
jgi:hypothetical protein